MTRQNPTVVLVVTFTVNESVPGSVECGTNEIARAVERQRRWLPGTHSSQEWVTSTRATTPQRTAERYDVIPSPEVVADRTGPDLVVWKSVD